MRRGARLHRVAAWLVPLLLAAACGSGEGDVPAGLNPGPPIRKAFQLSLEQAAREIQQAARSRGEVPQGEGREVLLAAGVRTVPQLDPWGGEVRYAGEGSRFTLSSAGPDGRWGTDDDLVVTGGE
ncbi:MAG: hypothetical protein ACP5VN_08545 [Acidobacteriota bacterium]